MTFQRFLISFCVCPSSISSLSIQCFSLLTPLGDAAYIPTTSTSIPPPLGNDSLHLLWYLRDRRFSCIGGRFDITGTPGIQGIYRYRHEIGVSDMRGWCGENVRNGGTSLGKGPKHIMIIYGKAHQCRRFVSSFAGNMVFLKSFKYGAVRMYSLWQCLRRIWCGGALRKRQCWKNLKNKLRLEVVKQRRNLQKRRKK